MKDFSRILEELIEYNREDGNNKEDGIYGREDANNKNNNNNKQEGHTLLNTIRYELTKQRRIFDEERCKGLGR